MSQQQIQPFDTKRWRLAEHAFRRHNVSAPPSIKAADLENPVLWAFLKPQLRTHDEIRVVAEDSTWIALVLVLACDGSNISTKTLWHMPLEVPQVVAEQNRKFFTKHRGNLGWCVVDKATGNNVRTNCASESDALKQLEEYQVALLR